MECLLGLLKVKVVRGVNLAICDPLTHSSDPYVILRLDQQVISGRSAPVLPIPPRSTPRFQSINGSNFITSQTSLISIRFIENTPISSAPK
jgi:hypothetical protein